MMNCLMSPTVWVWLNLPTSLRREEVSTKYNRVDVPANTHTPASICKTDLYRSHWLSWVNHH